MKSTAQLKNLIECNIWNMLERPVMYGGLSPEWREASLACLCFIWAHIEGREAEWRALKESFCEQQGSHYQPQFARSFCGANPDATVESAIEFVNESYRDIATRFGISKGDPDAL